MNSFLYHYFKLIRQILVEHLDIELKIQAQASGIPVGRPQKQPAVISNQDLAFCSMADRPIHVLPALFQKSTEEKEKEEKTLRLKDGHVGIG